MRRPLSPTRTGVWVGIAAIPMSFAAYTSAMVMRQGAAADWQHIRLPPLIYANPVVLLLTSVTLRLGRSRVRWSWLEAASDSASALGRPQGLGWLDLTLALGLVFLGGQILVWRSLVTQGLYLATSPTYSFFYVFTVLHAVHLLGGIVALGYMLHRIRRSRVGDPPDQPLGATALYWHFMDLLWLYLLAILVLRL